MINRSNYQTGATLITVLILLVLITIIGLYAIRNSIFSLKIATNAQVQTLLMQTSDVALDHLEKNFNTNESENLAGTPVGHVLLDGNEGKELQLCFKPTEVEVNKSKVKNNLFFNLSDFRIIERKAKNSIEAKSTAESGNINAFCDPTSMFSISRKAIVTQVAVVSPDDPAIEVNRFEYVNKGGDPKDSTNANTKRVRVTVTSFAPAMTSASIADMNVCLRNRLMDDSLLKNRADTTLGQVKIETLHECLNKLGVPLNTQVAEYIVRLNESKSNI